jgi:hypothetical protein
MIHDEDQGFVVPKRVVTVELLLHGRQPELAHIFVPATEGGALARHAVVDLLEKDHAFVPTQSQHERTPQIINKDALVWIAVASDAAAGAADDDALFEFRHEVRVELAGGAALAGELLYSLPPEHARVTDYLNSPGRFFRLWTAERLYLINKYFVERVVESPLDLEE